MKHTHILLAAMLLGPLATAQAVDPKTQALPTAALKHPVVASKGRADPDLLKMFSDAEWLALVPTPNQFMGTDKK